jgi:hypothetical protein
MSTGSIPVVGKLMWYGAKEAYWAHDPGIKVQILLPQILIN